MTRPEQNGRPQARQRRRKASRMHQTTTTTNVPVAMDMGYAFGGVQARVRGSSPIASPTASSAVRAYRTPNQQNGRRGDRLRWLRMRVEDGVVLVGCGDPDFCSRDLPIGSEPRVEALRRLLLGRHRTICPTAVVTTDAETAGVGRQCGCRSDCWCKRAGLRVFRWIAPMKHRSLDPDEKGARAHTWRT